MEAGGGLPRVNREDCSRTKHDFNFSKWQVLVGATDWEDHALGKEGAARYRIHNLPANSGTGLYELGIARPKLGRDKLDPDDIMVVYLGQSDDVRARLQRYGRSGAHLASSNSDAHFNSKTDSSQKGRGLFEEIFSRGFPIVFRWAPMKDKRYAEKIEAQLLETFDYAWNKGCNGARRPGNIIQKLEKFASSTNRLPKMSKKLPFYREGRVDIKIEGSKPILPENCTVPSEEDSKALLPGIFKFSRSQPRLVSDKCGIDKDFTHRCGLIMNNGIPCGNPPVPGRKRCEEHKGMRIYISSNKCTAGGSSSNVRDRYGESSSQNDQYSSTKYTCCGVRLSDGTFCGMQPVPGRKRCEEHRAMRISISISKPMAEDKCHLPALSSVFTTSDDYMNRNASSPSTYLNRNYGNEHFSTICGATLANGSFCGRQPVPGNKRCWQHKGKRVDSTFSGVSSSFLKFGSIPCGVTLLNGSVCMRAPVPGRKRCEQHKGMRVIA